MPAPTPAREIFADTPSTERLLLLAAAVEQLSAAAISASQARERMDQMQSEFAHAARLNEMGHMVSAFAHELNQPLAAANNYLRAAMRLYETGATPERIPELIAKADGQFTRASDIIKRIRGFAGKKELAETAEAIAPLICDAVELALLDPRHRGIEMVRDVPDDLPLAMVDRVQIQQVLLNLFRNAFEAMDGRPDRRVTLAARASGNMIEISVADNGPGLSPDVTAKLFQPFVTTKDGGMGIGLSICRSIVEAHGGQMWATPEPGEGAIFHFTVPVAK